MIQLYIFGKKFVITQKSAIFASQNRGVEQLVARQAHNLEADGSSPSSATPNRKGCFIGNILFCFFIFPI